MVDRVAGRLHEPFRDKQQENAAGCGSHHRHIAGAHIDDSGYIGEQRDKVAPEQQPQHSEHQPEANGKKNAVDRDRVRFRLLFLSQPARQQRVDAHARAGRNRDH